MADSKSRVESDISVHETTYGYRAEEDSETDRA